jgi:hypothetical protein
MRRAGRYAPVALTTRPPCWQQQQQQQEEMTKMMMIITRYLLGEQALWQYTTTLGIAEVVS